MGKSLYQRLVNFPSYFQWRNLNEDIVFPNSSINSISWISNVGYRLYFEGFPNSQKNWKLWWCCAITRQVVHILFKMFLVFNVFINYLWLNILDRIVLVNPQFEHPPPLFHSLFFWKMYLLKSKERVKRWFLIKSHFSWKFHWNYSIRSEDMKNFFVNINYFHHFFF